MDRPAPLPPAALPPAPLTIVNAYILALPVPDFIGAVTALAARVASEGDRGIRSYHFHASDGAARAVIAYDSPAAWLGHHRTAMDWPEMARLRAAARLDRITILGPFTAEMRDWLAASGLAAAVDHFPVPAGGFSR